jgi:hypothetical protein
MNATGVSPVVPGERSILRELAVSSGKGPLLKLHSAARMPQQTVLSRARGLRRDMYSDACDGVQESGL